MGMFATLRRTEAHEWTLTLFSTRGGRVACVVGSWGYCLRGAAAARLTAPVCLFAEHGRWGQLPFVGSEPANRNAERVGQTDYRGRLDAPRSLTGLKS